MSWNPYVFIVGCPRSGTTLLRRIVGAHSSVAITPETHWIPRYFRKRKGLTPEGTVTPDLIPRLLQYHRFDRMKISRDALEGLIKSGGQISYATFVSGVFDLFGKAAGKPLVGDKTPEYVLSLKLLHTLWPTARFVHLIRDGRDVCLSVTSWAKADNLARQFPCWDVDPFSTAATWWKWNVRMGREAGQELGPKVYYEMRYESLVSDPAKECKALCRFLDLPFEETMPNFHEGRTMTDPGLSAKDAWIPITPGLRDWRNQMAAEDVERFEAAAGDLLNELGYACMLPGPSSAKLRHAEIIKELFTQNIRSRGHLTEGMVRMQP